MTEERAITTIVEEIEERFRTTRVPGEADCSELENLGVELATRLRSLQQRAVDAGATEMPPLDNIALAPPREVILLDALGSVLFATEGESEPGLLLDIEGRQNKASAREQHRYLMRIGQAAELAADLFVTCQGPANQTFRVEFIAAVGRKSPTTEGEQLL